MRKLGGVFDRNWKTYTETANKYIRTHTQIVDVLYNSLEYSMLSTCIPIYVHLLSLKGAGWWDERSTPLFSLPILDGHVPRKKWHKRKKEERKKKCKRKGEIK